MGNSSSIAERVALGALAAFGALLSMPVDADTLTLKSDRPITLDADSTEFDYKSNTLVFHRVKIAQADMSVAADEAHATGLDFDDSRWVFHGDVKIAFPNGSLTSDQAQVQFASNTLSTALIEGNPAAFEQRREKTGLLAKGHADRIEYDMRQGIVRLSQDAWLTDGQNEIKGQTLKYSIREQRVVADAAEQGHERVKITINPTKKKP
jgi:lipopolysaccharide transport protein LptA